MRSKLVEQIEYAAVQPVALTNGTPLAQAPEKYFANLEARGLAKRAYEGGAGRGAEGAFRYGLPKHHSRLARDEAG
jgi:hypothetical protein